MARANSIWIVHFVYDCDIVAAFTVKYEMIAALQDLMELHPNRELMVSRIKDGRVDELAFEEFVIKDFIDV